MQGVVPFSGKCSDDVTWTMSRPLRGCRRCPAASATSTRRLGPKKKTYHPARRAECGGGGGCTAPTTRHPLCCAVFGFTGGHLLFWHEVCRVDLPKNRRRGSSRNPRVTVYVLIKFRPLVVVGTIGMDRGCSRSFVPFQPVYCVRCDLVNCAGRNRPERTLP